MKIHIVKSYVIMFSYSHQISSTGDPVFINKAPSDSKFHTQHPLEATLDFGYTWILFTRLYYLRKFTM